MYPSMGEYFISKMYSGSFQYRSFVMGFIFQYISFWSISGQPGVIYPHSNFICFKKDLYLDSYVQIKSWQCTLQNQVTTSKILITALMYSGATIICSTIRYFTKFKLYRMAAQKGNLYEIIVQNIYRI
ncbi:Hypothetical_protein [Hexamita inflata]|uniref:Hypothetical_protein n=1 Tax=Hexamita inflata TaxID=28002 RepID=A0AA86TG44_9EUKA|nr:Hypothetical protein HINF_LOCUS5264 [Hexamita inflata]